ncbi:MAG: hypothetical protein ACPGVE_07870, partial [Flavobacteriales bacterium]
MKKIIYIFLILGIFGCQKEEFEIIGTTESFTITSTNVNDNFKIDVYLPPNYPETNMVYPLVIGLDANFEFDNMAGIVSENIEKGN